MTDQKKGTMITYSDILAIGLILAIAKKPYDGIIVMVYACLKMLINGLKQ